MFTRQLDGLTPDTDYVAFAFGYLGGTATTRIFTQEFRTLEAVEGEVIMTANWDAYYDIPACYELDPKAFSSYDDYEGYAFLPMTFEFTPETDEFYYALYILLEGDEYSDAELITDLSYNPQQDLQTIWVIPYGYTMLLAGFGVDDEGNYGQLYRQEFVLDEDGVPSVVERANILPPRSSMNIAPDDVIQRAIDESPLAKKYTSVQDRRSAYEELEEDRAEAAELAAEQARLEEEEKERKQREKERAAKRTTSSRGRTTSSRKRQSSLEKAVNKTINSTANTVGRELGKQIARGILGNLLRK